MLGRLLAVFLPLCLIGAARGQVESTSQPSVPVGADVVVIKLTGEINDFSKVMLEKRLADLVNTHHPLADPA